MLACHRTAFGGVALFGLCYTATTLRHEADLSDDGLIQHEVEPHDALRGTFRKKVSEVWSQGGEQRAQVQGWYWMAHPMVLARVNTLISGDPRCDAYEQLARFYRQRGWSLPISHAVSLGCGFGNLERDIVNRKLVCNIDAYDLAQGAISEARRLAELADLTGITYHVADLDTLQLPARSTDAVFAHSAVHHVSALERLYETVHNALRPGGVFHLHEFVGPTRFQWTDAQIRLVNEAMDSLSPRLRTLPSGHPKGRMTRPTIADMIASDPSESVRSAELIDVLKPWFEVVEHRNTGGALLHLALGDIAQNFDPASPEDCAVLQRLFDMEDDAMARGVIGSDFAILTAVPRQPSVSSRPIEGAQPRLARSTATRLSLLLPPAKRLHEAINALNEETSRLKDDHGQFRAAHEMMHTEQNRLAGQVAQLNAELDKVKATVLPSPLVSVAPADDTGSEEVANRMVEHFLQNAALQYLPFLPGKFTLTDDSIEMSGYAGAPEGLTANMAFFINGHRFDSVEYPVLDSELASRFREVRGMGFVVRARMTEHLDELKAARFWRLDAAPTGHYVHAAWRRALHFVNPLLERFPLPPLPNITRVIGEPSLERFAMGGASIFKNLEHMLAELGRTWADVPHILDWGCGAGRVTRYLIGETECSVTGADIDPDNIAWCRAAYPGGLFETVPLRPPTLLEEGRFDLVIGLSVMTHLQESDQWLWLEELQRVTRSGALVFLSVQGPTQYAYNRFPAHLYRQVQAQGYLNLSRDPALDDVISDPEYYRAAMHSRVYITERWSRYFEIVAIVDAIAGLQDFVIMRRR